VEEGNVTPAEAGQVMQKLRGYNEFFLLPAAEYLLSACCVTHLYDNKSIELFQQQYKLNFEQVNKEYQMMK
jgi:hypothetical protein